MRNFYDNFLLNWCSVSMFNVMSKESQPNLKTAKEKVNCTAAHLLVLVVREAWLAGLAGTNASLNLHRHNFVC